MSKIDSYFNKIITRSKSKNVVKSTNNQNIHFSISNDVIQRKLLEFDLNIKYGPAYGVSRSDRYERAVKFGLNPPEEILEYIRLDFA